MTAKLADGTYEAVIATLAEVATNAKLADGTYDAVTAILAEGT